MATSSRDRTAQFPLIERRYGQPVSFWLERLSELEDTRYATLTAYLQEEHGFSRAHANTVVMYARGSETTQRYADIDAYLATLTPTQAATARAILTTVRHRFPNLEAVVAWNKPMLRRGSDYVFGIAAASGHLLLAPWGDGVLERVAPRLTGLVVNKKTIQIPSDWTVDPPLLTEMVTIRLDQLDARDVV
ncbi:MAG: DUF4287 domain-containing protein [Acidimicrobiales bacterium]